jgi:hypothetical protein
MNETHKQSYSPPLASLAAVSPSENCSGLIRFRRNALTGYSRRNPEGFKPSHRWHPIYRGRDESSEELWKRLDNHLLPVDEWPSHIGGVHVIAAVEGFLVTLDPRGWWPVLHPYPNVKGHRSETNEL